MLLSVGFPKVELLSTSTPTLLCYCNTDLTHSGIEYGNSIYIGTAPSPSSVTVLLSVLFNILKELKTSSIVFVKTTLFSLFPESNCGLTYQLIDILDNNACCIINSVHDSF